MNVKINKDHYDEGEDIISEQLITVALNKYEVFLASRKQNMMSPKQEHIMALTTVVEKLKDDNFNISNYFNTDPNKGRRRGNQ